MSTAFRAIPAVERVLQTLGPSNLPRPLVVAAVREVLAEIRTKGNVPEFEDILHRAKAAVDHIYATRLQPVINATGIVLHTNFGRAPLSAAAIASIGKVAAGYSNLEYDLVHGSRGSRAAYLERGIAMLCGSEAATVVNNCAAALILILRHLTKKKTEVLISRGELIQIGGGFRIPEILEASGARLREVGTTNRTSVEDYTRHIGEQTGMILKVHRSNFCMSGFVAAPRTEELSEAAHRAGIPLVEDLGSGALVETSTFPALERERTPADALESGVDLVCFSGDKLMGGPQAGLIAGRKTLVDALKCDPFFRALRCDKLILAALQATVDSYLQQSAINDIPTLTLLRISESDLRQRAQAIVAKLGELEASVEIATATAEVGGGTLPQSNVPSVTVELLPANRSLASFATRLRAGKPPVIGYIGDDRLKFDLRTVFPKQDDELVHAIRSAL